MKEALRELRLTIILFTISLSYIVITWINRLIKGYYHSPEILFSFVGIVILIWACVVRYIRYRALVGHEED